MLQKKQTSIQVIQITYRNSADPFYVWESVTGITIGKIFIPNFFILIFLALIMYPRTPVNFQSETGGAVGSSEFLGQEHGLSLSGPGRTGQSGSSPAFHLEQGTGAVPAWGTSLRPDWGVTRLRSWGWAQMDVGHS